MRRAADQEQLATTREQLLASTPPPGSALTIEQVAAWLQVGVEQARKMNLPAIRVGKNRWRYLTDALVGELKRRAE